MLRRGVALASRTCARGFHATPIAHRIHPKARVCVGARGISLAPRLSALRPSAQNLPKYGGKAPNWKEQRWLDEREAAAAAKLDAHHAEDTPWGSESWQNFRMFTSQRVRGGFLKVASDVSRRKVRTDRLFGHGTRNEDARVRWRSLQPRRWGKGETHADRRFTGRFGGKI